MSISRAKELITNYVACYVSKVTNLSTPFPGRFLLSKILFLEYPSRDRIQRILITRRYARRVADGSDFTWVLVTKRKMIFLACAFTCT